MEDIRDRVREFIKGVKMAVDTEKVFFFKERTKNRAFIAKHGLSPTVRREILLNLRVEDYSDGPFMDDRIEIMIFGVFIDDIECYIKLGLRDFGEGYLCQCISFHEAEQSMSYPLKGGE
jgi:hypothetical protein